MDKPHADFHFRLSHTSNGEDHDFYQDSCTSSTVNIYELNKTTVKRENSNLCEIIRMETQFRVSSFVCFSHEFVPSYRLL